MQKGYSLIELIIVIGIIVLVSTISIPMIRQFSIPQELKSGTQLIKSEMRNLHNNAINGVKNTKNDRVPWIIRFVNGQSYYEVAGCLKTEQFSACKDSLHDYSRRNISNNFKIYPCNLTCENSGDLHEYTGLTFYFLPVDGTLQVYNNVDTILPDQTGNMPLPLSSISLSLRYNDNSATRSIISVNYEGTVRSN